jgi:hypothetical protein
MFPNTPTKSVAAYGNVAPATVAAIQRALLQVEDQGGAGFFGEPALQLSDLMRTTPRARVSFRCWTPPR